MRNLAVLRAASEFDATLALRVLVAEDEPTQRLMLARTLGRAGYQVDVARDGVEALERLREGDYAMLVTDWHMPGLDGAALCREIRYASLAHYVYIVILTGQTEGADVVSGLDAGADDYVRKTAEPIELLARLAAGSRIVRLERSLRAAQARIELLSVIDPLLPLYNRRYLANELEREIRRARRYKRPFSLVIADIDHFKIVNDTHGHPVGDEVLQKFADMLLSRLRTTDWAARFGGEEFVVVLPETDLGGAIAVAGKLRAACAANPLETTAGAIALTASFGVATLGEEPDAPGEAAELLLRTADHALYQSKSGGRNRVTPQETPPRA